MVWQMATWMPRSRLGRLSFSGTASPGAAGRTATGKLCGRTYCWRARSRVAMSTSAQSISPDARNVGLAAAPAAASRRLLAQLLDALVGELGLARARVLLLQALEGRLGARLVAQLLVGHPQLVERGRHAVALGVARLDLLVGDLRAIVLGERVIRLAHAVEGVVRQLVVGRGIQQRPEAGER